MERENIFFLSWRRDLLWLVYVKLRMEFILDYTVVFLIQQHPEKLINLETPAFLNKIETLFKRHLIITPYYPHVLCSRE